MNDIHSILSAIDRKRPPAGLRRRILRACETDAPVEELDCEQVLELASAYLDDELHGHERSAFEAHVFACGKCYAAFKSMERTAEVLRETPPAVAPDDLHERINAAVARDAGAVSVFTWRRAVKVLGGLAAAAALFAAVVLPRAGGGDGDAPVIAEAQPAMQSNLTDHVDPAEAVGLVEPDEALDEPAEMEAPEETAVVTVPAPVRSGVRSATPAARSTEPRTAAAREARTAVRPVPGAGEDVRTPAPQLHPKRATSSPRRTTESARNPEYATRQPESEPVVGDDRTVPAPAHERTPEVIPEPPVRQPRPRETVVAATPRARDAEPANATASAATPQPVAATSAPQPGPARATTRLSVVPQQRPSSTVYQPEPAPAAEQSERLSRMAAGINNAQNPRMDNPRSGIRIN